MPDHGTFTPPLICSRCWAVSSRGASLGLTVAAWPLRWVRSHEDFAGRQGQEAPIVDADRFDPLVHAVPRRVALNGLAGPGLTARLARAGLLTGVGRSPIDGAPTPM